MNPILPGRVYELDGLKPGPIDHGSYTDDWISVVRPLLQTRIAKHAATEITFNLMAVVGDKLLDLQKQLESVMGDEAFVGDIKEKIRVEEEKRANYKVITYWVVRNEQWSDFPVHLIYVHSLPHGEHDVRQAFQMC